MPIRPLMRDPSGAVILPGRVKKILEWPFMVDTSLPATLTTAGVAGGNTVTVANQSAGTGELVITSVGGTVQVLTAAAINLASFEAVLWEAEGVYCPDANLLTLGFGINASGGGAYWAQSAPTSSSVMKLNPGGTNSVTVNTDVTTPEWWKTRRNMGMLITPRTKHVYVLMDDQVISDIDYSGGSGSQGTMTLAAVQPAIYGIGSAGGAALHVQQLRLTTMSY